MVFLSLIPKTKIVNVATPPPLLNYFIIEVLRLIPSAAPEIFGS